MRTRIALLSALSAMVFAFAISAFDKPNFGGDFWPDFRNLYDRDGDHQVSFDEFTAKRTKDFASLRLFAEIDKNDNQVIDQEDFFPLSSRD